MEYLVRKAQQGDGAAFIELIEMNKQSMYKVARTYFAEEEDIADAIQDTIEAAYRMISQLDKAKYFRTWLIRILVNKCIDIKRKKKRECLVEIFPDQGQECMELSTCEFEDLMRTLDEKYRTVLLLYYGEGFKITEIAQLLELGENTVKSRLSRGREKFRQVWSDRTTVAE